MPADAAPIVRRGHLRVDFTKGAHKLSRHLLVDPSTYLLEIVRVAILSGATRIAIEYDANDVVIEFDGTSFEYGEVEDLFARVVSESFDKRLYLLAVAVGAALTVSDGTVTVFGHQRDGTKHSTTYDNDAPGRATPGGKLPMKRREFRGTLIHVRRSFGLAVAKAALTHAEPREVKLVRERAARAPVAIFIRGDRARALDPLLRVELGSNLGLDVAIELVPVRKSPPTFLFAELGIPVVESTWEPEPWMVWRGGAVPIVVRADAPSLALNASRSRVQEEIVAETSAFAALGLPKLAEAIRERLVRGELDAETEDAIGTVAAGARYQRESCFAFLAEFPLLRDGLGRGVSLREVDDGDHFGFLIEGKQPLPPDHAHISREVLWLRGRAVEACVLEKRLPLETVRDHVNAGVKRRKRLLAMPSEAPAVERANGDISKRKIESPNGMRGELILRDPSARDPRAWATMRVYLEGHPIKTVTLDEHDVWLPFDAAISWEGRFEPTLAYDGLRPSRAMGEAIRLLAEEAGRALLDAFQSANTEASSGLRALALRALDRAPDSPALRAFPAFPTVDGRVLALEAIVAIARRDGAICYAEQDPPPNAHAPDGRDVFCLGGIATSIVARAIAPARALQYDAFLRPAPFSIESAFSSVCERLGTSPTVVFGDTRSRGHARIGLARATTIARFHAGYLVEWIAREGGIGTVMVTDEPSAFPDVEKRIAAPRIDDWIVEMRSRLIAVVAEGPADIASIAPAIQESVASAALSEAVYPILRTAPLFRMLDKKGAAVPVSAAQIVEAHFGLRPIPFLLAAPTFPVTDWRVVIAPEGHAIDALTKLTRRVFFKATLELRHRERAALASALRDDVMRKAPFTGPPPELHPLSPVVELKGDGFLLKAGLQSSAGERTRATILYDGRQLMQADFDASVASLTAIADFPASDAFDEVASLVEPRRSALVRSLETAIPQLGRALVATRNAGVLEDMAVLRFLAKAAPLTTGLFDGATVDVQTVNGRRVPLREVLSHVRSKRLRVGRAVETPWPVPDVPTALDVPMLLAPRGETGDALLAAFRAAGFLIDDMTRVIAEEAAKRRGEPPPFRDERPSSMPVPALANVPIPHAGPASTMPPAPPVSLPRPPLVPAPMPDAPAPPPEDPLATALLSLLKTTGHFGVPPYPTVRYTGSRRPVRYRPDQGGGSVEIGTGAKSIAALLTRHDVITLATSALSEVNRELVALTDQEEVNALLTLLRSL